MDNFFRRTVTGAGIVIFILGGFWLHPVAFIITGLILLTGSLYEYFSIMKNSGSGVQHSTGIIAGIAIYLISSLVASGLLDQGFLLLPLLAVPVIFIAELYRTQEKPFDSIARTLLPLVYIVLPFAIFPFTAFDRTGLAPIIPSDILFSPGLVIGFFILVWSNDTGAYLSGISLGRHKLMERISPKKTWEGFAGGMILSVIVSLFLPGWLGITGKAGWMVIAIIVSVAGTYGDLAESMLKRSAGVKDSGSIMPGHGGFLDRFDSTIMAFPLVYLFLTLFG